MTLIGLIIAGAIIGPLARLVMPGRQSINIWLTILLGAIGSFLGHLVWTQVLHKGDTAGVDWLRWLMSIGFAVVLIIIYGLVSGRKQTR